MNYIVTYEREYRGTHDSYVAKESRVLTGIELMELVESGNVVILLMMEVK